MEDLISPLGDSVFFAGEATSLDRPGYMDGAIVSGWREAEKLMKLKSGAAPAKSKL